MHNYNLFLYQYRLSLSPIQTQSEANTDSVWGHYRLSLRPLQAQSEAITGSVRGHYRLSLRPLQAQSEAITDSVWGQYMHTQSEANTDSKNVILIKWRNNIFCAIENGHFVTKKQMKRLKNLI